MSPHNYVVAVDDEVAHGSGRQVELQRLPLVAIIERDVNRALGSGEEQAFTFAIFPDRVSRLVIGQTVGDLLPGLAAVVRAVDIRMQVIETETVDGRISGLC